MRAVVIIPVRDDATGLSLTLGTLSGLDVLVACDGHDPAAERIARAAGARVVVLEEPGGSYAARNAALDALDADIEAVLFTDAGCLARPGWAAAHLRALVDVELSAGAVDVTHGARPTPAEWVDRSRNLRQQAYVEEGGYAATCNLAVRRSVLDEVRFDASLKSGGDREFCLRATRGSARLAYTADAVVEHPARRTPAAVLAKARRVGQGLASMPAGARVVPAAPVRPNGGLARQARESGIKAGPVWTARVAALDYRRAKALRKAALTPPRVDGLSVVILLASRWSSLESMNTRWRRVAQAWAQHPDVGRVTLVDHPRFRPGARTLVVPTASWLPGTDLLDVTVPTTLRPGVLDRVAWWRLGRALRAALPQSESELVVSTSSVSAPLLAALRRPGTTTAFDAVDVWRNLAVRGDLGARLEAGYSAVCTADRLTAVSPPIAQSLVRWSQRPVVVVANGVDLQPYARAAPAPGGLPEGPFAVYVGSLSSRLDVSLTCQLADELAGDVPVVLAGPADTETAATLGSSSVIWLGPVPTDLVPGLLQCAAVGLFPHRRTDLTEASDSMKLLEYAAAGLPVVSTDLPGLPPGVVPATGVAQFAASVRHAASLPRRQQPLEWVLARDWAVVSDSLLRMLTEQPAGVPASVLS